MSRWLIALFIAAGIVAVWLRQRERQSPWRQIEDTRRMGAVAAPSEPQPAPATSTAPAPPVTDNADARTAGGQHGERDGGLFQDAAARATGQAYERAAEELETLAAELAAARQQSEREAGRLSDEAVAAMAAIQAAADAHGGAVPGAGGLDCPADYPIKGSLETNRFHAPGDPGFERTTPDICFRTPAAAEAAGFGPVGSEAVVAEGIAAEAEAMPPGAVRGDGSRECPPAYPIKGNANSMLYHEPGSRSYAATIPEFCFTDTASAEAAGFSAPRR